MSDGQEEYSPIGKSIIEKREDAPSDAVTPKKSILDKMSRMVEKHSKFVLAIIIILVMALIGGIIYFYGFAGIGPSAAFKACALKVRNRAGATDKMTADKPDTDAAQIEKLISDINTAK